MFAKNWQWLFLLAALSALPAIVMYLLASWETDPWAPVAVLIVASPAALGITARALSLVAEKLGHPRPYSLWIEALFVSRNPQREPVLTILVDWRQTQPLTEPVQTFSDQIIHAALLDLGPQGRVQSAL